MYISTILRTEKLLLILDQDFLSLSTVDIYESKIVNILVCENYIFLDVL